MADLKVVKPTPQHTCQYKMDKLEKSPVYDVGCCDAYLVVQPDFHFCPFCGHPIELDPPRGKDNELPGAS